MAEYYENRNLFSDHYLTERLPERPTWQDADIEEAFRTTRQLYEDVEEVLDGFNEAETEEEFIRPILREVLGWSYGVQKAKRYQGRLTRPDYGLFLEDEGKREAQQAGDDGGYWDRAASVADAKYWGRPLDREGDPNREDLPELSRTNPSFQIVNYLVATGCDWGILTNGQTWRLYYSGARSRLDTYYEADLERIIREGDEEAFRFFLLFFRADAFRPDPGTGRTFLESVHHESVQYGTRLERKLKDLIFEDIVLDLARGYRADYERQHGAAALDQDALDEIFQGTLRFLYRLLFLLHAEARELLPVRDERGYGRYSLTHLKRRVAKLVDEGGVLSGVSSDLWNDLDNLFDIIDQGDPDLNVPQYNGGLFQRGHPANTFLNKYSIADKYLAPALDALTREHRSDGSPGRFIDYKSLDVEQLGSIYEGLLEFQLRRAEEELAIVRKEGREVYMPVEEADDPIDIVEPNELYLQNDKKERKATGSYYTPHVIVEETVERAVSPVLEERKEQFRELMEELNETEEDDGELAREVVETLLGLKVCDPAMGSGHFLVYTVDWLSEQFVTLLNEYPDNPVLERLDSIRERIIDELAGHEIEVDRDRLKDVNLLKRIVMKRCIYGVDLNPMAVELAKLSLWLDSFTVGAPLSFLDHHLKQGNSLIGSRIEEVRAEVLGHGDQGVLFGGPFAGMLEATELMHEVSVRTDATLTEVTESAELFQEFEQEIEPYKRALDLWTARDLAGDDDEAQKRGDKGRSLLRNHGEALIETFKAGEEPSEASSRKKVKWADRISSKKSIFHWELEFPEVFINLRTQAWRANPGFDAIIGNPPYGDILSENERIYLEETVGVDTSGRSEIYTGFLVIGREVLRDEQQLAFIMPNTMLDGSQFDSFRADLSETATPTFIRDFRSLQVFEEAETLTMIMVLRKKPVEGEQLVPCLYWDPRSETFQPTDLVVEAGSENPWRPVDPIVQRIEEATWSVRLEPGVAHCHDAGVDYKWKNVGWSNRGERKPLSSVLLYQGDKKHPDDLPLVKGEHISPFRVEHEDDFVIHDWQKWKRPDTTVLVYLDLAQVPTKIVTRQTADRPIAAIDRNQNVTAKSVHTTILNEDNDYDPRYVTSLLNSRLMHYVYEARVGEAERTFAQVRVGDLRELPIRAIRFETDEEIRSKRTQKGWELCESVIVGDEPVDRAADFVEAELDARPQRSDVVHDLLAKIAEKLENIAAERHRLRRALDPFKFLDRSVEFVPLTDALADGIKYGERFDTNLELAEVYHDLDGLRLRPEGEDEWLLEAQLKLRDPDTGWKDWLREDDGREIQRRWVPVFRMPLDEERARYYEQAFRARSEFVNAGSLPGGYTRSTMTNIRSAEVPAFDETADLESLVALADELEAVEARYARGRSLLDVIVFALYECDDQEVEAVRQRMTGTSS